MTKMTMDANELRALADALERFSLGTGKIGKAADYLRACADAKPVAWLRPENRVEEECTARTRISIGERCPPIGTWRPLYTHPAPAAPHPAVPTGYKLVPVDPTPEMLDEGCDVDARAEVIKKYAAMPVIRNPENFCSCGEMLAVQYRAMLAAAPAAPQAAPMADSDADYWLRNRQPILDAIERAGFMLMSNASGFWLHPRGTTDAQAEPKREPLSDDEISKLAWKQNLWTDGMIEFSFVALAREVERAHGIGGSDAE